MKEGEGGKGESWGDGKHEGELGTKGRVLGDTGGREGSGKEGCKSEASIPLKKETRQAHRHTGIHTFLIYNMSIVSIVVACLTRYEVLESRL